MTRLKERTVELTKPLSSNIKPTKTVGKICSHPKILLIQVEKEKIIASLADGRETSIPLD